MYERFKNKIKELKGFNKNDKVILAVSGGVDSVVLLHLMKKLSESEGITLIVAHVNHHLRSESNAEEKFVEELAKAYQLSFHVCHWPKQQHPDTGIEEAARNIRYQFFKDLMAKTGASYVMTAHHQDDQVETIMMKLTRGSVLEQLAGIKRIQPFHTGFLIRPLLSFSKDEIYHYAGDNDYTHVEDPSNQELVYARNRFRNQIIPLIKEENSQFTQHIEQFSADLQDLLEISKGEILTCYRNIIKEENGQFTFDIVDFMIESESLQRAVLNMLLQNLYKESKVGYKKSYVALIQEWLQHTNGHSQLNLAAGITVKKVYQTVTFSKQRVQSSNESNNRTFILEDSEQTVQLSPSETLTIKTSKKNSKEHNIETEQDLLDTLLIPCGTVEFPLTIRHRQPGDRMTYKGLSGTKKIKDIFIDEKVPLNVRDKTWIVEDANGIIIWLIGFRKMYLLSEKETDKLTYILKYNNKNE